MAFLSPRSGRRALFGLLAGALSAMSPAWAGDAKELIAKVEAKYATVTSLKANFKQTTKSELFGEEVVQGDVILARPAKMRWQFGKEKLFVADGKQMWIYAAEDKQVIVYDDISAGPAGADSVLTSLDKLNELFEVTVLASTETEHELRLKPLEEGQFSFLELKLNSDLVVERVRMVDSFDNLTLIEFSDVALNVDAKDELFTFAVPEGVSVINADGIN